MLFPIVRSLAAAHHTSPHTHRGIGDKHFLSLRLIPLFII